LVPADDVGAEYVLEARQPLAVAALGTGRGNGELSVAASLGTVAVLSAGGRVVVLPAGSSDVLASSLGPELLARCPAVDEEGGPVAPARFDVDRLGRCVVLQWPGQRLPLWARLGHDGGGGGPSAAVWLDERLGDAFPLVSAGLDGPAVATSLGVVGADSQKRVSAVAVVRGVVGGGRARLSLWRSLLEPGGEPAAGAGGLDAPWRAEVALQGSSLRAVASADGCAVLAWTADAGSALVVWDAAAGAARSVSCAAWGLVGSRVAAAAFLPCPAAAAVCLASSPPPRGAGAPPCSVGIVSLSGLPLALLATEVIPQAPPLLAAVRLAGTRAARRAAAAGDDVHFLIGAAEPREPEERRRPVLSLDAHELCSRTEAEHGAEVREWVEAAAQQSRERSEEAGGSEPAAAVARPPFWARGILGAGRGAAAGPGLCVVSSDCGLRGGAAGGTPGPALLLTLPAAGASSSGCRVVAVSLPSALASPHLDVPAACLALAGAAGGAPAAGVLGLGGAGPAGAAGHRLSLALAAAARCPPDDAAALAALAALAPATGRAAARAVVGRAPGRGPAAGLAVEALLGSATRGGADPSERERAVGSAAVAMAAACVRASAPLAAAPILSSWDDWLWAQGEGAAGRRRGRAGDGAGAPQLVAEAWLAVAEAAARGEGGLRLADASFVRAEAAVLAAGPGRQRVAAALACIERARRTDRRSVEVAAAHAAAGAGAGAPSAAGGGSAVLARGYAVARLGRWSDAASLFGRAGPEGMAACVLALLAGGDLAGATAAGLRAAAVSRAAGSAPRPADPAAALAVRARAQAACGALGAVVAAVTVPDAPGTDNLLASHGAARHPDRATLTLPAPWDRPGAVFALRCGTPPPAWTPALAARLLAAADPASRAHVAELAARAPASEGPAPPAPSPAGAPPLSAWTLLAFACAVCGDATVCYALARRCAELVAAGRADDAAACAASVLDLATGRLAPHSDGPARLAAVQAAEGVAELLHAVGGACAQSQRHWSQPPGAVPLPPADTVALAAEAAGRGAAGRSAESRARLRSRAELFLAGPGDAAGPVARACHSSPELLPAASRLDREAAAEAAAATARASSLLAQLAGETESQARGRRLGAAFGDTPDTVASPGRAGAQAAVSAEALSALAGLRVVSLVAWRAGMTLAAACEAAPPVAAAAHACLLPVWASGAVSRLGAHAGQEGPTGAAAATAAAAAAAAAAPGAPLLARWAAWRPVLAGEAARDVLAAAAGAAAAGAAAAGAGPDPARLTSCVETAVGLVHRAAEAAPERAVGWTCTPLAALEEAAGGRDTQLGRAALEGWNAVVAALPSRAERLAGDFRSATGSRADAAPTAAWLSEVARRAAGAGPHVAGPEVCAAGGPGALPSWRDVAAAARRCALTVLRAAAAGAATDEEGRAAAAAEALRLARLGRSSAAARLLRSACVLPLGSAGPAEGSAGGVARRQDGRAAAVARHAVSAPASPARSVGAAASPGRGSRSGASSPGGWRQPRSPGTGAGAAPSPRATHGERIAAAAGLVRSARAGAEAAALARAAALRPFAERPADVPRPAAAALREEMAAWALEDEEEGGGEGRGEATAGLIDALLGPARPAAGAGAAADEALGEADAAMGDARRAVEALLRAGPAPALLGSAAPPAGHGDGWAPPAGGRGPVGELRVSGDLARVSQSSLSLRLSGTSLASSGLGNVTDALRRTLGGGRGTAAPRPEPVLLRAPRTPPRDEGAGRRHDGDEARARSARRRASQRRYDRAVKRAFGRARSVVSAAAARAEARADGAAAAAAAAAEAEALATTHAAPPRPGPTADATALLSDDDDSDGGEGADGTAGLMTVDTGVSLRSHPLDDGSTDDGGGAWDWRPQAPPAEASEGEGVAYDPVWRELRGGLGGGAADEDEDPAIALMRTLAARGADDARARGEDPGPPVPALLDARPSGPRGLGAPRGRGSDAAALLLASRGVARSVAQGAGGPGMALLGGAEPLLLAPTALLASDGPHAPLMRASQPDPAPERAAPSPPAPAPAPARSPAPARAAFEPVRVRAALRASGVFVHASADVVNGRRRLRVTVEERPPSDARPGSPGDEEEEEVDEDGVPVRRVALGDACMVDLAGLEVNLGPIMRRAARQWEEQAEEGRRAAEEAGRAADEAEAAMAEERRRARDARRRARRAAAAAVSATAAAPRWAEPAAEPPAPAEDAPGPEPAGGAGRVVGVERLEWAADDADDAQPWERRGGGDDDDDVLDTSDWLVLDDDDEEEEDEDRHPTGGDHDDDGAAAEPTRGGRGRGGGAAGGAGAAPAPRVHGAAAALAVSNPGHRGLSRSDRVAAAIDGLLAGARAMEEEEADADRAEQLERAVRDARRQVHAARAVRDAEAALRGAGRAPAPAPRPGRPDWQPEADEAAALLAELERLTEGVPAEPLGETADPVPPPSTGRGQGRSAAQRRRPGRDAERRPPRPAPPQPRSHGLTPDPGRPPRSRGGLDSAPPPRAWLTGPGPTSRDDSRRSSRVASAASSVTSGLPVVNLARARGMA